MFKNYLKTAIRSLSRNKNYTIINIAGLAAGISVCLLIYIIIRFETSFDSFHAKKDRIYRILTEFHHQDADGLFYGQEIPEPLPTTLRNDFPQLEKTTGIDASSNDQVFVMGDNGQIVKKFKENTGVFSAEPAFFEIFDFPLLAGNPSTALKDPNSAILTKEIAEKYFGDWKNAIGKLIKLDNRFLLKITGILATIPPNTDFQIKIITPYSLKDFSKSTDWESTSESHACYILLPSGSSAASFDKPIRAFSKKYRPTNNKDELVIQSLSKVHTYDKNIIGNFLGKTISPEIVRGLWLIGVFILLIACVNFINLSTAQAVNRAREVGVRKVLGSNQWQLKIQFILETTVIVFSAVFLAISITAIVLPAISKVLAIPLTFDVLHNPGILLFLFLLMILVTALAGFYPSIVLSSFKPIEALKSKLAAKSTKGISVRRGLVVFQFIIAQALIIGTLIMIKQMDYFRNSSMGFDKESIVNVPFPSDSAGRTKVDYLRNKLMNIKGIQHVSFNSSGPADDDNNWTYFKFDHAIKNTDFYAINKWADTDYLKTYNLTLAAGRNFHGSDSMVEFIVNETLVKKLGIANPEAVLNKEIDFWGNLKGPVVGVLKDFHSTSLKDAISPVLITKFKRRFNTAGMKLTTLEVPNDLKSIEKIWGETFPDYVFEYQFLDAKIDTFYKQETQLSQLFKIFAGIAIFLSCLGLYGLASFMAVQRIKEVGIRKVLGATSSHIVFLFSKEFIILIGIAFAIASPLSWYFMHKWLQDYVYRIKISWWIFIIGGGASVIIALATISFNAIKAAMANPVKSLRTE